MDEHERARRRRLLRDDPGDGHESESPFQRPDLETLVDRLEVRANGQLSHRELRADLGCGQAAASLRAATKSRDRRAGPASARQATFRSSVRARTRAATLAPSELPTIAIRRARSSRAIRAASRVSYARRADSASTDASAVGLSSRGRRLWPSTARRDPSFADRGEGRARTGRADARPRLLSLCRPSMHWLPGCERPSKENTRIVGAPTISVRGSRSRNRRRRRLRSSRRDRPERRARSG